MDAHLPVTQADLVSHHILQTGLAHLAPHWPVLSEESSRFRLTNGKSWRHFWMIDPLDGTKEFLHRTGEFTVNIALIEDDQPILGVVYAPVIDPPILPLVELAPKIWMKRSPRL